MDLVALLSRHEGKTLEFKRDLSAPEGVLRSIVAFANTSGGVVLLGVEDRTRKVTGIKDVLAEEERLANLIADSISPKLVASLDVLPWRKTYVLAAEIHPSPNRPHYLAKLGPEAGVYVRVGSTNRRADPVIVEEMQRYRLAASFDEQPIPELNSEAIDFRAASEYFQPIRKLTRQGLESLKATTVYQGRIVPTIGGLLLFGKDRLSRFPDAWIQAGRFAGLDRRRILDSAEVRSYLPRAVEEAIAFVQKHMSRESVIGAVKRTDLWTLPAVAVREAVVNAIVHADYAQIGAPIRVALYDDRMEIENPGLLPFGLTIEDIQRGVSKLRNRVIGRVFQELGLIEQWGSGVQRMTAACLEHGLGPPVFEEIGTHFRVTFSAVRSQVPAAEKREQTILKVLGNSGQTGLSTSAIAGRLGISLRTARKRLASLVERGLVVEIGSGPQDPHRRYHLATDGPRR